MILIFISPHLQSKLLSANRPEVKKESKCEFFEKRSISLLDARHNGLGETIFKFDWQNIKIRVSRKIVHCNRNNNLIIKNKMSY